MQEKVIPLTDICATEKTEGDHDCSSETVGNDSEGTSLKQDEESCNPCEEQCLDQKESMNEQEGTTEVQNAEVQNENTGSSDQEANNEATMAVTTEGLVSAVQCINKRDNLPAKHDSLDEDEDITNGFNKLALDEEPSDDSESLNDLHDSETKMYEVVNEDPETAFCTLANREAMNTEEGSVLHCLYQFTHNEKLCENNKLLCDVCTQRQVCGPKTSGKSMLLNIFLPCQPSIYDFTGREVGSVCIAVIKA